MKAFFLPERFFNFLMYCLSFLFAWFLMGFGGLIIEDLPKVEGSIKIEQFDSPAMKTLRKDNKDTEKKLNALSDQRAIAVQALKVANTKYQSEQSNFNNWIATRTATESAEQNPELIKRNKMLERLKANEDSSNKAVAGFDAKLLELKQHISQNEEQLQELQKKTECLYKRAVFIQELKVFALRLLFILPILLLAIYGLMHYRRHKYWPFVWGFAYFAFYAFFIELVPYLPSYGGYVHYLVGILILIFSGHYGIRWMQNYRLQRAKIAEQSEALRRETIDQALALKKISKQICPSCERSVAESTAIETNFCMHCGLHLFQDCAHCKTRHNVFYAFCPTCGEKAGK